jgi:CheY-like chemotaxis protein
MMVPLTRADLHEAAEAAKIDFTINKPVLPSVLYNAIVEIFNPAMLEAQGKSLLTSDLAKPVTDYPYHVLIVEDNKTNQFIAKTILEQSGLRTSIAENGQEGYDCFLALQDELDAILMDLHMPVLDGFEATALIRTKNKKIPIIAMTADAITGIEEQCRRIGIDHYVSKPFDPDQFVATIIEVIQSQPRMVAATEKSKKQTAAARDEEAALDVAAGSICWAEKKICMIWFYSSIYLKTNQSRSSCRHPSPNSITKMPFRSFIKSRAVPAISAPKYYIKRRGNCNKR